MDRSSTLGLVISSGLISCHDTRQCIRGWSGVLCRYSRRVKVENSCKSLRPPGLKMVISFVFFIWNYRWVCVFFSSTLPLCQSGSFQTGFSITCSGFGFISILCYSGFFWFGLVVLVRVQYALVLLHHLRGFISHSLERCHDRINVQQSRMSWQNQCSTKHNVMTGSTFNKTWCHDRINVQQSRMSWQNQCSTKHDVMTESMFNKAGCHDRINIQQSRMSQQNQRSTKRWHHTQHACMCKQPVRSKGAELGGGLSLIHIWRCRRWP